MTTAFVLWGGGSLAAVQVGMLRALNQHGVRPDVIVGASVGRSTAHTSPHGRTPTVSRNWHGCGRPSASTTCTRSAPPRRYERWSATYPFHPVRGGLQALGALN